MKRDRGPGLAKARGVLPLVRRRVAELWQSADYPWREILERADVMSEGAVRSEPEGPTYYGSTSVLLPLQALGVSSDELDDVVRLLNVDPHIRLRAIRIACLEAQLRSGSPIGRVRAELCVRRDARGARIDVDVEVRVARVRGHSELPPSRQQR